MEIKKYFRLFLAFLFLLLSCVFLEETKAYSEKDNYEIMLEAAERAEAAFFAIQEEKLARGFLISPEDDPNQTGLIGEPYTEITTTLGNLEAKRSTANPNTAAMIVDMLSQCGVQSGSTVAVNLSSSFPAINIAALCALDALGADGIVINSVGSSTYGANLPEFTYLDMEHFLYDNNLLRNHSQYFSLGGAVDQGKEMPEKIKNKIVNRLTGYELTFLDFDSLEENISFRMSIYEKNGPPVCFVNAGGNILSFGGGSEMVSAKNGIVWPDSTSRRGKKAGSGLIPLFLEKQVPVLHLLNMKSLLPSYGLPIDPIPLPKAGEGDVYYCWKYNRSLAALLLLFNASYLLRAFYKFPRRRFPL